MPGTNWGGTGRGLEWALALLLAHTSGGCDSSAREEVFEGAGGHHSLTAAFIPTGHLNGCGWEGQISNGVALLATLNNDMEFAKVDIPQSCEYIVGIDEAGRGALAGPMSISAAVLKRDDWNKIQMSIYDSKQFSFKAREEIFREITKTPWIQSRTSFIAPTTIDSHGLRAAYLRGLRRLLKGFDPCTTLLLLDAGIPKLISYPYAISLVNGDSRVPLIGIASIQAKVLRDRKMIRYGMKYPSYGFERHMGYGTKLHRNAISQFGLCDIHRKSWNIIVTPHET